MIANHIPTYGSNAEQYRTTSNLQNNLPPLHVWLSCLY